MLLWSNFVIMLRYAVLCQPARLAAVHLPQLRFQSHTEGTRTWSFL
jgi:hypothetical protein